PQSEAGVVEKRVRTYRPTRRKQLFLIRDVEAGKGNRFSQAFLNLELRNTGSGAPLRGNPKKEKHPTHRFLISRVPDRKVRPTFLIPPSSFFIFRIGVDQRRIAYFLHRHPIFISIKTSN